MKYLSKDWYGAACPRVGFEITQTEQWQFKVAVPVAPEKQPLAQARAYQEGLWEQDVAEWFIANPATGRYVECNLSANGAWWLMAFIKPRQRVASLPRLAGIVPRSEADVESWQAELHIPIALLVLLLGGQVSDWTYNVCFIIGKAPRQYISLNTLSSTQPDFHRVDEFLTTLSIE